MDELFDKNQHDFKCGHCQEKFSNIDDLKSHMLSIHSKVKNLCDANDATFENKKGGSTKGRWWWGGMETLMHRHLNKIKNLKLMK